MKRKTLTAKGVERARHSGDPRRRRMDWDAVVPGLALRTTAHGSKSWVLVTRAFGRVRFVTLGKPPGFSLPAARALARERLERVARGEDPRLPKRVAQAPLFPLDFSALDFESLFIQNAGQVFRGFVFLETQLGIAEHLVDHDLGLFFHRLDIACDLLFIFFRRVRLRGRLSWI